MLRLLLADVVYYLFCALLSPFLLYRVLFTAKHRAHIFERFGNGPRKRTREQAKAKPTIWIHAVSVGEVLATKTLVAALREALPDWRIAISATTKTGRAVAKESYPDLDTFQYPLDFSWACARALSRLKPAAVVLMELELWPNFTLLCQRRGIPLFIANGRLTAHSSRGYARFGLVTRGMFRRPRRVFAQTQAIADRFARVGTDPAHITVVGSVKYDALPDLDTARSKRDEYRRLLGVADDQLLLIAGSTHPPEHEAVVTAWRATRDAGHDVKLLLVPRHPEKRDIVREHLSTRGLAWVNRSSIGASPMPPTSTTGQPSDSAQPSGPEPDSSPTGGARSTNGGHGRDAHATLVIIGDTMGELALMYAAADLAFIGGSLIKHGGQNMLEPCGLGVATVFGPHVFNFKVPVEELLAADAAVQVKAEHGADATDLTTALLSLAADPDRRATLAANARRIVDAGRGATARTVAGLVAELQNP